MVGLFNGETSRLSLKFRLVFGEPRIVDDSVLSSGYVVSSEALVLLAVVFAVVVTSSSGEAVTFCVR